jgi:adhesin HecA-like repeat protein
LVWFFLLLFPALPAPGQVSPQPAADRLGFTAAKLVQEGSILHGRGRVRATSGKLVLYGDEGTFNRETGEIELRGRATTTLPARADRNLIRYATRAVVTEQAVVISADRLRVKNGLLRGWGQVDIRTARGRLHADEIDVYVNLGDGQLRGNIRFNGAPARTTYPLPVQSLRDRFPPEIIKER